MIGGDPPSGYRMHRIWVEDVAYDNDLVEEWRIYEPEDWDNVTDNINMPKDDCGTKNCPTLDELHEVQR